MCDYTPGQLTGRSLPPLPLPQDIIAISARPYGQRAVLKFANYTGAKSTVGRHTPGEMLRMACCALAGLRCCAAGGIVSCLRPFAVRRGSEAAEQRWQRQHLGSAVASLAPAGSGARQPRREPPAMLDGAGTDVEQRMASQRFGAACSSHAGANAAAVVAGQAGPSCTPSSRAGVEH